MVYYLVYAFDSVQEGREMFRGVIFYVKELDRKPHTLECGGSLSILNTSACFKSCPKGQGGTSCL